MTSYKIPTLPLNIDIETKSVLKKASEAHRYLGELKGIAHSVPNEMILVNTLSLQEARDSSEIENIITTQDELFQSDTQKMTFTSTAAKEVHKYAQALSKGYSKIKETNLLTVNQILEIQETLIENKAGFRKLPGTELIAIPLYIKGISAMPEPSLNVCDCHRIQCRLHNRYKLIKSSWLQFL